MQDRAHQLKGSDQGVRIHGQEVVRGSRLPQLRCRTQLFADGAEDSRENSQQDVATHERIADAGTLLSMTVQNGEVILNQPQAWIEHYQRFARQDCGTFSSQFMDSMLATAKMIAIENLRAIACNVALVTRA